MTNPILTDDKIDVNPQTLLIRYDGDTKQLKKQILTALDFCDKWKHYVDIIRDAPKLEQENQKLKAENEELKKRVDYDWLNLRFNVVDGIVKLIVNCGECGNNDHVFSLPDGNWNIKNIIDNMNNFVFSKDIIQKSYDTLQQENNKLKEEKEQFLALIVKIQSENEELKQFKQRIEDRMQYLKDVISENTPVNHKVGGIEGDIEELEYIQQLLKDDTV